jgi:hypothetical protein
MNAALQQWCTATSVTVCVYCVRVGTAVYWRVGGTNEAMFPAPGAEPRRAAQHGATRRARSTATQHGATRRARSTATQQGERMGLVLHRRNIPLGYQSDW